jgi:hypothetical protein
MLFRRNKVKESLKNKDLAQEESKNKLFFISIRASKQSGISTLAQFVAIAASSPREIGGVNPPQRRAEPRAQLWRFAQATA